MKCAMKEGDIVRFQDMSGIRVSIDTDQVVLALYSVVPGNPYNLMKDEGYFSEIYSVSNWD